MEQTLKNLPIGIQDFESLINDGYLYVDKTALMHSLASTGRYYFLSRPRRFGKSLLISTLKAYFLGKKELFKGLAVEQLEQKWTVHPVLHLDFNACLYNNRGALEKHLSYYLSKWEDQYGRSEDETSINSRFQGVIKRAYEKSGQRVVVLVDEVDKPMLETIGNETLQREYLDIIMGFFSPLKSMDGYFKFALLVGITGFRPETVFGDLNNLTDISIDRRYNDICGFLDDDLKGVLAPYIHRLADKQKITFEDAYSKIDKVYNGYHFSENTQGVYNPWSLLNVFFENKLGSYWFQSGSPNYLVKLLKRDDCNLETTIGAVIDPYSLKGNSWLTSACSVPVLYKCGYLTIKEYKSRMKLYKLDFPNEEVKRGFLYYMIPHYTSVRPSAAAFEIKCFVEEVRSGDAEAFMNRLESYFANTPYDLIKDAENHYQNVLFILCNLCGLYTQAEFHTSNGRVDMTIETADYVYIFEFKYNGTAEEAMEQIKEKNYAQPFMASGKKIVLIGANFSGETRNIDGCLIEDL